MHLCFHPHFYSAIRPDPCAIPAHGYTRANGYTLSNRLPITHRYTRSNSDANLYTRTIARRYPDSHP